MGKISSLPKHIRDELNTRLADCETESTLLPWLNSLPETQDLLRDKFRSNPISPQNLSEYRKRGFQRWKVHQDALEFLTSSKEHTFDPAAPDLHSSALLQPLLDYICLRFTAAAQSPSDADDSKTELRHIQSLLYNIIALRRGELVSRRIDLEQQRLKYQQLKTDQDFEERFWEWAKRPEIIAKLAPHRQPDAIRSDVLRLIDEQVLGLRHTFNPNGHPPPAVAPLASAPDQGTDPEPTLDPGCFI